MVRARPGGDREVSAAARSFRYPARVIAHRGGGTLAPENTLAGLREARVRGFAAVEFDVMLARGDAPILMHDDTLERTTSGAGAVPEHAVADLARLDAGSWRDARFAGEPVPTLAAAARVCRDLGLFANVELKPYAPGGERVARRTGSVVATQCGQLWSDATDAVLLSSFSEAALDAARAAAPQLARARLFDAVPADWQARLRASACLALHCNGARLDAATARAIKAAGYGLMCWTVNDPGDAHRLFDWGVDAVCTDRLDLFAALG
ncbi:MAG: glycerophosphodiester phosphodiesterase [Burkholderiales bacterium]|nr:glycerophosphodiester phosphodiesterase [Burkholderiales bacterium]